jgi:hypothetical protein
LLVGARLILVDWSVKAPQRGSFTADRVAGLSAKAENREKDRHFQESLE